MLGGTKKQAKGVINNFIQKTILCGINKYYKRRSALQKGTNKRLSVQKLRMQINPKWISRNLHLID